MAPAAEALCSLGCFLWFLAVPSAAWADLNMQSGLWEITTTLNGAPAGSVRKCYLPKDLRNLEASQHGMGPMANPHCQTSDYKATRDTVTFTMTCKTHEVTTTSEAQLVFEGDRTAGVFKSSDGNFTSVYSRRIADCSVSSFGK